MTKDIVLFDIYKDGGIDYFQESKEEWIDACKALKLKLYENILFFSSSKEYDNVLFVHTPIEPLKIISKISKTKSGIYGPCLKLNSNVYLEEIAMKGLWNKFLNYNNYTCTIEYLLKNWTQAANLIYPKNHIYHKVPAYFIRPCSCRKQFTGGTFTLLHSGLDEFKCILRENEVDHRLKVQISPSVLIDKEWRFVIVDNKIVDYSLYKDEGFPCFKIERNSLAEYQVKSIIDKWAPARAYTIDVALLPNGNISVIEYNSLSCSGLYECSKYEVLKALKEME